MTYTFGDYARNVREADIGFMVTERGGRGWAVRQNRLGSSVLQFGTAGAGMIADGIMPQADSVIFVLQSSLAEHHVFLNGHRVTTTGLVVLVPGSDFLFTNQVPHRWISVSLNLNQLPQPLLDRLAKPINLRETTIINAEVDRFTALARCVETIARHQQCRAESNSNRQRREKAELINALTTLGTRAKTLHDTPSRQDEFHYYRLVRQAVSSLPPHATLPIEDLRHASGIEERTLRRAFQTVFRLPPIRYLKLRQLNQVHAALIEVEARGQLVTDILTHHGVTELGRFATEYRALFGEPPSQTVRRSARAQRHSGDRDGRGLAPGE